MALVLAVRCPVPLTELRTPEEAVALDFEKLQTYLASKGLDLDLSFSPRQMKGGLSNLNFITRISGEWAVLRCAPRGELPRGAHDRVREHRVLSRLPDAFPLAPRSLHLCENIKVVGSQFQILEYRSGRSIRGTDMSSVANVDNVGRILTNVMVDLLASLHDVDPASVALQDLGRPGGFVGRSAENWTNRGLEAAATEDQAELVAGLARWLAATLPDLPRNPPTLLHCDFKLDNIMLAHASLDPVAVLDWDMCTRGEPLFDLATLLSYWTERDDPDCMHRLGQMPTAGHGFPSRAEVVQLYGDITGRSVQGFFPLWILCLVKLGVVFLQLDSRWRDGTMGPDEDGRSTHFGKTGWEILEFAKRNTEKA